MDRKEVMEFFNKRPRNCILCTATNQGDVNVAVYGSPRMIDEDTVVLESVTDDLTGILRKTRKLLSSWLSLRR